MPNNSDPLGVTMSSEEFLLYQEFLRFKRHQEESRKDKQDILDTKNIDIHDNKDIINVDSKNDIKKVVKVHNDVDETMPAVDENDAPRKHHQDGEKRNEERDED